SATVDIYTSPGMLGPSPGQAPTPAMTLPPLRELDRALGPESDQACISIHHSATPPQPRSQSSDPHLHQHFHQQRPHSSSYSQREQEQYHQQQQQQPPFSSSPQGYQPHDQLSRYSSTASLP
ncbi:hypothetical protein BX616_009368, partial [Lobosporangium transversale]